VRADRLEILPEVLRGDNTASVQRVPIRWE
jgi:hypothetical protein